MTKHNDNTVNGAIMVDALRKAGKSEDEIAQILAVASAQDGANEHRKLAGVVQESFISRNLPIGLFRKSVRARSRRAHIEKVLVDSLAHVNAFVGGGKLFDEKGAFNNELEIALTESGFYRLTIPQEFGGEGATMHELASIMLKIGREGDPTIPGTLSVKTLIGPVGAVKHLGTDEQKQVLLTFFAKYVFQGAFAGTEPGAGCNITKIKTYGVIDGDDVLIYGEKCFISRACYGGRVAVFLKIDGKFRVIEVELPQQDTPEFQLKRYELLVLQPALQNNGLIFNGLRVPLSKLLPGNGLEAIFKDLDDGRWAVGISAAVLMSLVLAASPEWIQKRETFGKPLADRQGIQYRVALTAALMTGAEQLSLFTADSIDEGRAGDLMAMIAKTWSTDALREVMTKHGIEIHGGRFFVKDRKLGTRVLDALVSTVYEGPNPMLAQAAVNALVKAMRTNGLDDLADGLKKGGVKMLDLMPNFKKNIALELVRIAGLVWKNKGGLWSNRKQIVDGASLYLPFLWNAFATRKGGKIEGTTAHLPDERFVGHLEVVTKYWFPWRWNFIDLALLKYGERLADEQMITEFEVYKPLETMVTMLVAIQAAADAAENGDTATVEVLNLLCEELKVRLSGSKPTSKSYRKAIESAFSPIMDGQLSAIENIPDMSSMDKFFGPYTSGK